MPKCWFDGCNRQGTEKVKVSTWHHYYCSYHSEVVRSWLEGGQNNKYLHGYKSNNMGRK